MYNQNSKFFENALTGLCILEITALVHFSIEHFKQTADCASTAADALAAALCHGHQRRIRARLDGVAVAASLQ